MGRNKEESMNIRKIRRLLHETKKIAENASLTGSLQGGAKIAIRQYNAILNHLQETGAIPEDLFQTLDEDECNFGGFSPNPVAGISSSQVTPVRSGWFSTFSTRLGGTRPVFHAVARARAPITTLARPKSV